ncbi:MAG: dihydrolipoamide acetyltransferase family protein [Candidatus Promineifilaceae bacterium]|jgi:2-oxoglutarate dehydrogenase E2 component (dihydrolipoamide succinyltransferase)
MAAKIIMPQLGESVIEGTISAWLKREGDSVEQYEPVLEIETDKVTTEAIAETSGIILKIMVPEGETVAVGTVLAYIGAAGEEIDSTDISKTDFQTEAPAVEPAPTPESPKETPPAPPTPTAAQPLAKVYTGRISPLVGRIAAENEVDLNLITGTGKDGRITKKDILAYIESRGVVTPIPAPTSRISRDAPELVPGELIPLTGIRKAIAEHMVLSKRTSPHVTTVFEIDYTAVAAHRAMNKEPFARQDARLTFTVYIIAAIAQALHQHPLVNSSWTDEGILLKKEINIGMAAAIPDGLIVPVIKDADRLDLVSLAKKINDLSERARAGKLLPDEVQGGTFTLTNHGVSGSLFATPIINQPQCAIFGAGKIEDRVKVIDNAIAIRRLAYASLTFDHRILDGARADDFMTTVKDLLENWS